MEKALQGRYVLAGEVAAGDGAADGESQHVHGVVDAAVEAAGHVAHSEQAVDGRVLVGLQHLIVGVDEQATDDGRKSRTELVGHHDERRGVDGAHERGVLAEVVIGALGAKLVVVIHRFLHGCGIQLVGTRFRVGGNLAGSFCTALGVMLFNAIVFLFLCDISKRFGVSALLLFGIEESLILVSWVGREGALLFDVSGLFGGTGPAIGAVVAIAAIVAVATLVLNEREIGERWGIAFMGKRPPEENERTRLARRCAAVAEARRLTPREREVMELLAQGKSLSGVAHELIIAEGTAKAHTRHIYEKLGINTRQELLDSLMTEQQRAGSYKDALSHDPPTTRQIARHIRKIWSAQGSSDLCEKRSTVGKRCPLPQGGSPAGNPYEETAATQA